MCQRGQCLRGRVAVAAQATAACSLVLSASERSALTISYLCMICNSRASLPMSQSEELSASIFVEVRRTTSFKTVNAGDENTYETVSLTP